MNEYVNQAMALIQKMIAAATPIAVKAYNVALITLQIDAAAALLPAVGAILLSVVLVTWVYRYRLKEIAAWKAHCVIVDAENLVRVQNNRYSRDYMHRDQFSKFDGVGLFVTYVLAYLPGVFGIFGICHVWMWVKLVNPELWLVHMAIEKLVK